MVEFEAARRRLRWLFSGTERKTARLRGTGLVLSVPDRFASKMTQTQKLFLEWNAERLGISLEESEERYDASWAVFKGGHSGRAFRAFRRRAYGVFRVLYDEQPDAVFETYRYHGSMQFLSMLTYPEPQWSPTDLVVRKLPQRPQVSILDLGCGLAQQSQTLAEYLRDHDVEVRLTLVDIPTLRQEFLVWWGERSGIATKFLECTAAVPIPELPECDICLATEFFEHVFEPVTYFDRVDARLSSGGLLVTSLADHPERFLHVSPKLDALRARVTQRGYEPLVPNRLFQKP